MWGKGVWVWASGRSLSWVGGGVWTPHSGHPHPGRLAGRPYWGSGQGGGRRRGWKVPDGCARRRLRLCRCVLSASADVPHRRRPCDSPELLRGCGGDPRNSRRGAVPSTRSAEPLHRCAVSASADGLTSATAVRQPLTSERMWRRREKFSLWGSPVHQKCSTILRDGSGDP